MNNFIFIISNKPVEPKKLFYINNNLSFSSLTFNYIKNDDPDTTQLESIEGYLPITEDNIIGVE